MMPAPNSPRQLYRFLIFYSLLFLAVPNSFVWCETSSDEALNAAVLAQEAGRQKQAIEILSTEYKRFPENMDVLSELAWAQLNEGHLEEAASLFDQLMDCDPSQKDALLGRGIAYLDLGQPAQAVPLFKKIVEAKPKNTLGWFYLGQADEALQNLSDAVSDFEKVIKIDSHFVEARLHLGPVFEKMKDFDSAWRQFARISYTNSNNAIADQGMARLASKITKKPEEIIPPKTIDKHSNVTLIKDPETISKIRVGIGCSSLGRPTPKNKVSFHSSHPFKFLDVTGEILAEGQPNEIWKIELQRSNGAAYVYKPDGTRAFQFFKEVHLVPDDPNATLILQSLSFAPGSPWGGMADKEIRGSLEILIQSRPRKNIVLVNVVNIEAYVYGVLAAEMPSHWPMEALKAQAILARSIGVIRRDRLKLHRKYGYDLCDEQHCQVYSGVQVENDRVHQATDETRCTVLTYDGQVAHTVFHSNCGGKTQSGAQAGWGNIPYWQARSDTKAGTEPPSTPYEMRRWAKSEPALFCSGSKQISFSESRWRRVVPASVIAQKLPRNRRVGRVRQIHILKRNSSGWVQAVRILGTDGAITLKKENEIRNFLAMGSLRSTQFQMDTIVRDGKAQAFVFYGNGWGHGVGFCQSGAAGRAEAGQTVKEILEHYFPGTQLTQKP